MSGASKSFGTPLQVPVKRLGRRVFGSVVGLLAVGCGIDEGFRRCLQFWLFVLPLWGHYFWVDKVSHCKGGPQGDAARDAEFERLHARYSPMIRWATLYMRGFYLKAAQLMSSRDDFLPATYLEWTKKLQNEVPMALSGDEARQVIVQDLGLGTSGVSELLSDWDDEPIGAASIGQVYKARLKATGEWVAVKVQVPGAERLFRADIACLKMFTYWVLPWAYENMVEIEKLFSSEFDYVSEFRNLEAMRANLMPIWGDRICVPRPIPELSSTRVLGMQLLRGEKFVDAVRRRLKPLAEREGKTLEEYEREQYAALLSGRRKAESASHMRWKMRLWRWWQKLVHPGQHLEHPIDLGAVFELLMEIHGQQIFIDGCFNADPHPGNILLLEDGVTLGLIDFGQVVYLPMEFRMKLAHLMLALARRNPGEVARCERDIGVRRKNYKEDVQYRVCSWWLDRDSQDIMQGLNLFDFHVWGEEEDSIKELPDGYYMVCRCSVTLRSAALAFGLRISAAEYWKSYAKALLDRQSVA